MNFQFGVAGRSLVVAAFVGALAAACGDSDRPNPTDGDLPNTPPTGPASPSADAPAASVRVDKTTFSIPYALADRASVFRLADGRVVVRLFTDPAPAGSPLPWTSADEAAVKTAVSDLGKLGAGTIVMLPGTRWPRAQLPQSFAADLPPGACSLSDTPRCELDPSTSTRHVPLGELPRYDGQDRTFMGPNVAGGLIAISKVSITQGEAPTIDLIGTSVNLGDVFDKLSATSTIAADADADGYAGLSEPFRFDLSGREIYSKRSISLKLKTGRIDVAPKVKTRLLLEGASVREAQLALKGDVRLDAELELTVTSPLGSTFSHDLAVTLFEGEASLPPIAIGPVPVAQSVKLAVQAKCHLEAQNAIRVSAGASLHSSIALGGHYVGDRFENDFEAPPPSLSAIGPTVTRTNEAVASCSLDARFSLLFYGVIGPYVGLSSATTFQAKLASLPPSPRLDWRLDGKVAADMGLESQLKIPGFGPVETILSSKLANVNTQLFAKEFPLASGTLP